jgi:hypothetical protein
VIFANPNTSEVAYVCMNLRQKSKEEIFAVNDLSAADLAKRLSEAPGFKWVAYHNGLPAALIGAIPLHGGVWSLFGMGTDNWIKVWRQVTLVAKRDMMQAVLDAGGHRAQCMAPASHEDTHKWLRFLGATHEVQMPAYGRNKEDYILFAWIKG